MMRMRTRERLVPFVLCTMGALLLFLAGCRKEKEIPASSPAVYMKDTNFLNQVSAKRKELQAIVKERKPLVERMEALIKAHGEDLASLQKIPEWNDLHKKVVELNKRYEEVRARQLKIVRNRLAPVRDQGSGIRNQKEKAISK